MLQKNEVNRGFQLSQPKISSQPPTIDFKLQFEQDPPLALTLI